MVLDTSALIALLDADDGHHAAAEAAVVGAPDDLVVNVLTLTETAVAPGRLGRLADVADAVQLLDLQVAEVTADDWEPLARLRADTRLRLPDCCVLHTALQHRATVATFDRDLARAAEHAGLRTVGL